MICIWRVNHVVDLVLRIQPCCSWIKNIWRLSSLVLRYYNLEEEVTLQCDASQFGLGAALLQNEQPVAYAKENSQAKRYTGHSVHVQWRFSYRHSYNSIHST